MTGGRIALTAIAAVTVLWMLPLIRLVTLSLEGDGMGNYVDVVQSEGLLRYLGNSALVTGVTVVLVLVFASAGAFAFSKLRFRGRNVIYAILLTGLMIPVAAILVPLSEIQKAFGLYNTYPGLILPYTALALPFALILLRGAYDALPDQLLEAAVVDGASTFRAFVRVLLPLTSPTLVMVGIWTFLNSWNEFLLALLFMSAPDMRTVTVVPASFQLAFFVDVPKIFAALVLIQLPVVLLYAALQKKFESGLTAGAVK
ncbi:carbohydrate ABC transporter permease [Microbacterium radiodurans]|uniref:Carbohydrate ABC transporter permease n=1 Tax=Microbacterium radiodurans TaxID=661398 RepID=A0A5J5IPV8_9MICO|nr:carbohydrate ABC transporter permease [Microbacterium radiodurans]KAA9083747.1 carbohydrate ABC transporter permease [Microbacterium radiodurans]